MFDGRWIGATANWHLTGKRHSSATRGDILLAMPSRRSCFVRLLADIENAAKMSFHAEVTTTKPGALKICLADYHALISRVKSLPRKMKSEMKSGKSKLEISTYGLVILVTAYKL